MIKLNVNQVLREADAERRKPKPLPKVAVKKARPAGRAAVDKPIDQQEATSTDRQDDPTLRILEREYLDVRMQRSKESSKIVSMVEAGAPQEDLRLQYEKIESYRSEIRSKYDQLSYYKQHGQLPARPVEEKETKTYTLYELKDRKRKLIDRRCKLQAKLKPSGKPSKPFQIATWQMELDQSTAEYELICDEIKRLDGKI
jgi:hypothetical protein